jgi:opacity protein-like surface antigen
MRNLIRTAALLGVALSTFPLQARAEGFVNPWAGVNFGSDIADGRAAVGVNAGVMGAGIIGGELGLGYSPRFFGTKTDFGSNTVIDVMANVLVGVPLGGLRPYVTAGLGIVRTQIDGGRLFSVAASNTDPGWNAGGGVMGHFTDHMGVRLDLRYFRNFNGDRLGNLELGGFHYWRASLGLTVR